jgi:hypothetical protein
MTPLDDSVTTSILTDSVDAIAEKLEKLAGILDRLSTAIEKAWKDDK